ncbi:MAG: glycosyltransferase family 4 protein [Bacteroidota bacterium]|nr:glycosyltransferase family 4 protein [Bacteroidota bacterium]
MKISVIVQGRFHAFEMASYFQTKGILNELITGYPKSQTIKFGIESRLVKSIYINEIINRVTYKLFKSYPLDFWANDLFDYITSKVAKYDSDVYFIWSGCALRTIRSIRRKNKKAKIILVRGSAHIAYQDQLLRSVNGSGKALIDRRIVAKELQEYNEADYINVPSTFALNSFIEQKVSDEKLFLNLLGVDLRQFPFYKKEVKETSELIVGNVGALSKRKNVASIIRVVEKLNKENIRVKLILAGSVDNKTFDVSILDKHHFIDYRGRLPQSELHKVYSEFDVFIINSIEEGLAMVQLQAMSCGLPIISTTNAGGLDLVREGVNGFTIPILDEKALAEKITWFYNNKHKIPEMGIASRKISEEGLTWEDFGERNIEFINKIVCCNSNSSYLKRLS